MELQRRQFCHFLSIGGLSLYSQLSIASPLSSKPTQENPAKGVEAQLPDLDYFKESLGTVWYCQNTESAMQCPLVLVSATGLTNNKGDQFVLLFETVNSASLSEGLYHLNNPQHGSMLLHLMASSRTTAMSAIINHTSSQEKYSG